MGILSKFFGNKKTGVNQTVKAKEINYSAIAQTITNKNPKSPVGRVTHIKMSSQTFSNLTRGVHRPENGTYLTRQSLRSNYSVTTSSDIEIDDSIETGFAHVYENGFVEKMNF